MPIVSVCPYCTRGHVRTNEEDIGTTAKCPSCGSEFTLIPTEEAVAVAATGSVGSSNAVPAVFAEDTPPRRLAPATVEPPAAETLPDTKPLPAEEADPDDLPDPARVPGMIASAVALTGVVAWMVPDFGRLVWLALAVVSAGIAGWSFLAADRKKLFAWIALGAAGGSLLLCLALPSLFGEGWWPARGYNADEAVALGADGVLRDGRKEIDVTKADWFKNGVRVRVTEIRRQAVTVTVPGASGKKPTRKTTPDVFQIVIEVSNDGAPRPPVFTGWTDSTPAVLRTAADTPVKTKTFEVSPDAGPPGKPLMITSGISAYQTLYFEAPPADAGGSGSLELPVAAFGDTGEPVKLMVPLRPFTRPSGGNGGGK